jgi:hypothetical protein
MAKIVKLVHNVVWSDQWKSVQEISTEAGIEVGCIHNILH